MQIQCGLSSLLAQGRVCEQVLPAVAGWFCQHPALMSHAPSVKLLLDCYSLASGQLRALMLAQLLSCLQSDPSSRHNCCCCCCCCRRCQHGTGYRTVHLLLLSLHVELLRQLWQHPNQAASKAVCTGAQTLLEVMLTQPENPIWIPQPPTRLSGSERREAPQDQASSGSSSSEDDGSDRDGDEPEDGDPHARSVLCWGIKVCALLGHQLHMDF